MSDDFEDLLKRWLRDHGATDRSALEAMAGHVAALPPRRRRQAGPLAAAAAVVLVIGLAAIALAPRPGSLSSQPSSPVPPDPAAIALAPRPGSLSSQPSSPVPPDPAAFAGDPRLARCANASVASALDVFEMTHARDVHRYLPAMLLAPELDVDAPAFVVVFRDPRWYMTMRGVPLRKEAPEPARQSPDPMHHDLCILVGADPATAEMNAYVDVDITGLQAILPDGTDTSPIAATPATASEPASSTDPEPTPKPQ